VYVKHYILCYNTHITTLLIRRYLLQPGSRTSHLRTTRTLAPSHPRTSHAMMAAVAQFSFVPEAETRELASDLRDLFAELAATVPLEQQVYSGECHPALDVVETPSGVEIIVDVAGVPPPALRVLFRGDTLIIAGEKAPAAAAAEPTFHLVEREFGRFARAVRLTGAFDVQRAHASLAAGELTIVLPRLADRRGRAHTIPVTSPADRRP
jgi:HSP20 family protein